MSTDWITPGAEVVTYSTGSNRDVRRQAIEKVAKRSFTVTDGSRFPIDSLQRHEGGTWGRSVHVVPADSETALEELAGAVRRRLMDDASRAVDEWVRNRTRENRLAAIVALQAIDDDEVTS